MKGKKPVLYQAFSGRPSPSQNSLGCEVEMGKGLRTKTGRHLWKMARPKGWWAMTSRQHQGHLSGETMMGFIYIQRKTQSCSFGENGMKMKAVCN